MRPTKFLATLVAVATALLLTVGLVAGSAQAGTAGKAKQQIITASDKRVNNHKFIVSGKSTLKSHSFVVEVKRVHTSGYKKFSTSKADKHGKFRFTITGNLGDCFAVRLPAADGLKGATVKLGCIHTV